MNVPKVLKKSGDAVTLIVHMDIIEPKYSIKPTGLKQYTIQYVQLLHVRRSIVLSVFDI